MKHLVFVYGTLKKGFHNDCLIDGQFYDKAKTAKKYLLVKCNGLPFMLDTKNEYITHVKGEVYLIDDNNLLELDHLEGHSFFYKRKKIKVYLKGIQIDCWCYLLNSVISDYEILTNGEYVG